MTSETGSYQFPRLEIGTYAVRFELTGFKTVVNEGIVVTVNFNAQVNAQMGISTVQETITVTSESPIVDTKEVGTKQTFTNELLQSIPSARDPWVILQQTAGVAMDHLGLGFPFVLAGVLVLGTLLLTTSMEAYAPSRAASVT